MMRCIQAALDQGAITPDEARRLNEGVSRMLREGLAPPEVKARMVGQLTAEAQEVKRRALLQEQRRQILTQYVLNHKNARGENDPAEALTRLLENQGEARFIDVATLQKTIAGEYLGRLEQLTHEFRARYWVGHTVRDRARLKARLRTVLDEVMTGAKTAGNSPEVRMAREIAKAWLDVVEAMRQRFNGAGGHIEKLDYGYNPQSHDPAAVANAGGDPARAQSFWVDYMMRDGVLDRDRMVSPITGEKLNDTELRRALEVVWERITTDGWIDREPTYAAYGKGMLANRYNAQRFLHFKDAAAWMAYAKDFGKGDVFDAMMQHVNRMSRDIATLEQFGPNPDAMVNYLKQLVSRQASIAKPAASVIGEQTARLKEIVENAAAAPDGEAGVADQTREVLQALAEIQRRIGAGGTRDVGLANEQWNVEDRLRQLREQMGELEDRKIVERERTLLQRFDRAMFEQNAILNTPAKGKRGQRRNEARVAELSRQMTDIQTELAELRKRPRRLAETRPDVHREMVNKVETIERDLDAMASGNADLAPVEEIISGFADRLRRFQMDLYVGDAFDRLRASGQKIERVQKALGEYEYRLNGQPLGVFVKLINDLANDVRQRRLARDPELRADLERQLEKVIADHKQLTLSLTDGADDIARALELTKLARPLFEAPSGFRAVRDPVSKARKAVTKFEEMWEVHRGASDVPVDTLVANVSQTARNLITAALLGSAAVSAAVGDTLFQARVRRLVGMPKSGLRIMAETMNAMRGVNRREAARAMLIHDAALNSMHAQARYVEGIDARNISGFLADRTLGVSGLTSITQGAKDSLGLSMMGEFADRAGRSWAELEDGVRDMLRRHGIEEKDWDVLRTADIHQPDTPGWLPQMLKPAGLLRPNEIQQLPGGRELSQKYMAMIYHIIRLGVPEQTMRSKTALVGNLKPGTYKGEGARFFGHMKSFPMAVITLHMLPIIREWQAGNRAGAVGQGASLLIASAIYGTIINELMNTLMGRDMLLPSLLERGEVPGYDYWMQGVLKGGGLGIYGDFFFGGAGRFGGFAAMLVGPVPGVADRIRHRTTLELGKVGDEEKDNNWGRVFVQSAREVTPFSNVWYARLALDRWLFSTLQDMLDPEADAFWRRMKQMQERRTGQGYWFAPGTALPQAAPWQQRPWDVSPAAQPVQPRRESADPRQREMLVRTLSEMFEGDQQAVGEVLRAIP